VLSQHGAADCAALRGVLLGATQCGHHISHANEAELDANHFQHLFLNTYGSVLAAAPCDLIQAYWEFMCGRGIAQARQGESWFQFISVDCCSCSGMAGVSGTMTRPEKLSFMVDNRTATLQRAQYNLYYTVPFVLHSSRT